MKEKLNLVLTSFLFLTLFFACSDHRFEAYPLTYPNLAEASNPTLLGNVNGVQVYNGGFGSALVQDPRDPNFFYMLTDRGPNIDGTILNSKVFARPDFVPQVGKFRLVNDQLVLEQIIELKNQSGGKMNGLPNPGLGSSGEIALDVAGNTLTPSVTVRFRRDGIGADGSFG